MMTCGEISTWLLATRSGSPLPRDLERHLQNCRKCRRLRDRLHRLDQGMQTYLEVSDQPAARANLLEKLRHSPSPPRKTRVKGPWASWFAAAALLGLIVSGIWLLSGLQPLEQKSDPSARARHSSETLIAQMLDGNLRLADARLPRDQFVVLADMAQELGNESLRLARARKPDDLPLLIELYRRLVQQGLVGRSVQLSNAEQREVLPPVIKKLQGIPSEVEALAKETARPVQDFLHPLAEAAREGSIFLVHSQEEGWLPPEWEPDILPPARDPSKALVSALVLDGLRLAEAKDDWQRVDSCQDVADHLLQAIVLASARGDSPTVAKLGRQLSLFLDKGVTPNLARLPVHDPQLAGLQLVLRQATQVIDKLDHSILQAAQAPNFNALQYDQVKQLEKTLREVEKALKKAGRGVKDWEKEQEKAKKEKEPKGKGKGKGKKGEIYQGNLGPELSVSQADVMFALHQSPATGRLALQWQRSGQVLSAELNLPQGWKATDLSWRKSMKKEKLK